MAEQAQGTKAQRVATRLSAIIANVEARDGRPVSDDRRAEIVGLLDRDEPDCLTCGDRRWIVDPTGRSAKCPSCVLNHPTAGTLLAAGFADGQRPATLASFDITRHAAGREREKALGAVRAITAWLGRQAPPLLVIRGKTGIGKSHLAEGAAMALIARGDGVWYVTGADFADSLRDMNSDWRLYRQRVAKVPWLILDDVGAGTADRSAYVASEGYEYVIQKRLRTELPTLLTSNLDDGQMQDAIGDRIVARFVGHQCGVYQWHPATNVRAAMADKGGSR